ncbi:MAG TPA: PKD domain-containing protein [Bacteroidia bacterium]|nr:PKD domain-containing protein [Bacteroidia bacterium]
MPGFSQSPSIQPYTFFQGDTLNGFDLQAALGQARVQAGNQVWNTWELKAFVYGKEKAFVHQKYNFPAKAYPAAHKSVPAVLNTACNNVDFEAGSFAGWTGGIGYNDNTLTPLTVSSNGIFTLGMNAPETSCAYHTLVTAAAGNDPYTGLPMLDPGGGTYAVRLGGENINILSFGGNGACSSGDTAFINGGGSGGEVLQQTFVVTPSNNMFTYSYMVVMNQVMHSNGEQPYFRIEVLDSTGAQTNSCHQYYVQEDSTGAAPAGFITSPVVGVFGDSVYYLPWTHNAVNLNPYMGKSITLRFTAAGCTLGGHFAYAYVDCSCSKLQLTLSTSAACSGKPVTIYAPPGASSYIWHKVPAGPGIIGSATSDSVVVNQTGKYTVTITNGSCTYTVDTTLTFIQAPVFTSSVTPVKCHGQSTGSASITITGGGGPYTYSWSTTPVQTGTSISNVLAGTYTVNVSASNGCGSDTVLVIKQPPVLTFPPLPPLTICISQSQALLAVATGGVPPYTYSWTGPGNTPVTPPVSPVTTTTYTLIVADSNGCLTNLGTEQIIVNPPLETTSGGGKLICPGASAQLTSGTTGGDNTYSYTWIPTTGLNNAAVSNPVATPLVTTTYTVISKDGCGTPTDSALVTVTVATKLPAPVFTQDDSVGCAPVCIHFTGSSDPPCISAIWNFGDSTQATGCGAAHHCYTVPGSYTVSLTVTDSSGCKGTLTKPNLVVVNPVPVAAFTWGPQPVSILNPVVQFTDQSTGASAWSWQFNDSLKGTANTPNPIYTFGDTGCYPVILAVENSFTCKDTARHVVCIKNEFTFYAPNSFTPNGDGKNDVWTPVGEDIDVNNYTLYIFDRWGNQMFSTAQWGQGWDGTFKGNKVQLDTYVWRVLVRDLQGHRYAFNGNINVINH